MQAITYVAATLEPQHHPEQHHPRPEQRCQHTSPCAGMQGAQTAGLSAKERALCRAIAEALEEHVKALVTTALVERQACRGSKRGQA